MAVGTPRRVSPQQAGQYGHGAAVVDGGADAHRQGCARLHGAELRPAVQCDEADGGVQAEKPAGGTRENDDGTNFRYDSTNENYDGRNFSNDGPNLSNDGRNSSNDGADWRQLTDREMRRIAIEQMEEVGVAWSVDVELYVRSALVPPYNPVTDYLDGCCEVEGIIDTDTPVPYQQMYAQAVTPIRTTAVARGLILISKLN